MGKKEKSLFVQAEDFQAMISVVPKLAAFLKTHNEIGTSYQKYRKNGGAAIPGIEKHFGIKELKSASPAKTKKTAAATETKAPEKVIEAQKEKKKVKK